MRKAAKGLIRVYQWFLSPLIGQQCRFYPTCSSYALGALERYSLREASFKILRRLGRCHPASEGGIDLP